MHTEKSQGLLLQAIPYLGSSRILKIFTKEDGLICLFTKKKNLGSLLSPFCIGEWIYQKKQGDMYTLKDASLLDPLLPLRDSFTSLSCAGIMAQEILKFQLPNQTTQNLYELICSYFRQIHRFPNSDILSLSFRLKLLLYEGLLSIKNGCSICSAPGHYLYEGENFCSTHSSPQSILLTPLEWDQFYLLIFAQKFSLLQQIEVSSSLTQKIDLFLRRLCDN